RGFDYYFHVFTGDHRWKYWQTFIKASLQYMLPVNTFDLESMRA
ncbi:esterase family protein, partial [Listeria monocytogenes]|nr:esterase family protein [Listeria monocytogenes]